MSNKKILYIAGYGRSGSTLLCAVLGGLDRAIAVGELKTIFSYYSLGRQCSCGKQLNDCDFWSSVVHTFLNENPDITLEEANRTTEMVEGYKNWFSLRYRNTETEHRYHQIWKSLTNIIFELSGCDVIVDASKSSSIACNRVATLSGVVNVQQIHLVRDPRSVMSSTLSAVKRRYEKHGIQPVKMRGVRTLLSWSLTNLYIHTLSLFKLKDIKVRVSYEQLTNEPKIALNAIREATETDTLNLLKNIDNSVAFPAGHIFSGDFQRMKGDYLISAQAAKWPDQLNFIQRTIAWSTYPIARFYGFLTLSNRSN